MSRTSKERPASRNKRPPDVVAPLEPEAPQVVKGLEGLVPSIGELRGEAMLRAAKDSIESQKQRTKMPERTLTAAEGLEKAKALHNIKARLAEGEVVAAKEISAIREKVKLADLQAFDDVLDRWLKA